MPFWKREHLEDVEDLGMKDLGRDSLWGRVIELGKYKVL